MVMKVAASAPVVSAARASCRAPRHCRLSTPPSSRDGGVECRLLLRSLRGGANGRVSTPPTPSPTTAAPAPSTQTAPTAARASRLFAHDVRRDEETCNWASDADCDYGGPGSGSARPGPTACGTGPSSYVVTKVTQLCHDAHDRDPSPYLRTAVPNSKSN